MYRNLDLCFCFVAQILNIQNHPLKSSDQKRQVMSSGDRHPSQLRPGFLCSTKALKINTSSIGAVVLNHPSAMIL